MHNRLDGEVVIDYLALVCHSRGKDDWAQSFQLLFGVGYP
jgi:hypothetical protein